MRLVALALLAGLTAAAAQTPDAQGLEKAADGFYRVYLSLHPSDGIPDAATRARFAPFVSPALDALFADGEAAEARYAKATKHQAPPLIEGDLFSPNFEGATAYRILSCAGDDKSGHCAVRLTYDDRKDKPLIWTDTVYLVRAAGSWRVDDIAYGGNWDFGNKGRLTQTLKGAIADGNSVSQ